MGSDARGSNTCKGTPHKKNVFFRALPEKGGGEAHAQIFWTFFYHVLVPKIGIFLPKTLTICMLFGHFLLSLSSNYHHYYHWTVIIIIGIFSAIRAKRCF